MKCLAVFVLLLFLLPRAFGEQTVDFSSYEVREPARIAAFKKILAKKAEDKEAYLEAMDAYCSTLKAEVSIQAQAGLDGQFEQTEGDVCMTGKVFPFQTNPDGYPVKVNVTQGERTIHNATPLLMQPNEFVVVTVVTAEKYIYVTTLKLSVD